MARATADIPEQFRPDSTSEHTVEPSQESLTTDTFAAGLSTAARATVESLGGARHYAPGEVLFRQEDGTDHVVVLRSGWVKVTSTARTGDEALLALRGPGDVLGELSAVDGWPRSATVTALVAVRARIIQGDDFVATICRSPELSRKLLRHLAVHLRDSDRKRLQLVSADTFRRLVELLVELAATYGEPGPHGTVIRLPLTQRELATAGAMSREAVARGLRTLRERDLVRTERKRLTVRADVLRLLAVNLQKGP